MELMGAIQALASLREPCKVDLHTDSQYVQKGMTLWIAGWKKKKWKKADNHPVKNADLWQELDKQTQRHEITWHWVKGHSNHTENDIVDALANHAIDELQKS
jgi:ribonuclease HI